MEARAKVLVVDDEQVICKNVEKILKGNDFEVTRAMNTDDALERLTRETFSLLISDIVMPGRNGLELLKSAKKQWPETKALMMTAYASTDTAVKAIRLGALDYIAKPFTPEDLRTKVSKALSGELREGVSTPEEREDLDVSTLDLPPRKAGTVESLEVEEELETRGVTPQAEMLEGYCRMGEMVCDIFLKLGQTCKVGVKKAVCPQKKGKARIGAESEFQGDVQALIGVDMPFDYQEVVSITGPEYIQALRNEGVSFVPYAELKKNYYLTLEKERQQEEAMALKQQNALGSILVVEDEWAVNNNIMKILSKKGYHIEQAVNKEDSLEKIRETQFKVVLLDLKMPGVKGLELLKAIREVQPETKVIIITGYASLETAVETARLGAVDFLAKPFTPAEIRTVTGNAMRLAA